jgi:hypothetical protein
VVNSDDCSFGFGSAWNFAMGCHGSASSFAFSAVVAAAIAAVAAVITATIAAGIATSAAVISVLLFHRSRWLLCASLAVLALS